MTAQDRWLLSGIFVLLMALTAWLLNTVSINTGRISVLEQRANTTDRTIWEMRDELKQHRTQTERK